MLQPMATQPATAPTTARVAAAALGACALLSGAIGAIIALLHTPTVWFAFAAQCIIAVTGLAAILSACSPRLPAPALAMVCLAGAVFTAATLGRFSAVLGAAAEPIGTGEALRLLARDPWFLAQSALAAAFGVLALVCSVGADRRAWKKIAWGGLTALPVLAAGVWIVGFDGDEVLLAPADTAAGVVRIVSVGVGSIAAMILISISTHLLIGAFAPPSTAPDDPPGASQKPLPTAPQ